MKTQTSKLIFLTMDLKSSKKIYKNFTKNIFLKEIITKIVIC